MSEENNLNEDLEPTDNATGETAENTSNDAAESVEDTVDGTPESIENTVSDASESVAETAEEMLEDASEMTADTVDSFTVAGAQGVASDFGENTQTSQDGKGRKSGAKKAVIITICAVVAAAAVAAAVIYLPKLLFKSKYDKYVDVTGRTIGQVAQQSGMEYKEFLEKYSLPADMPENTNETSAYNAIPFGVIIEMNQFVGMESVEDAKKILSLPDWVTEDTTWGEAIGEAPLKAYVGEENLDRFKEIYGLDDKVTGDTLYKEIKNHVDEIDKQKREEAEKQAQSAKDEEPTQAPTGE